MDKKKVLILDGDSRQCLPFLRFLHRNGHHTAIVCPWKLCPGYFSRYADEKLIWPDINHDEEGFYADLLNYVRNEKCDVIMALGDATAILVAKKRSELTKYVRTPVPDWDILIRAADKNQTIEFCMANNIPCPKSFNPEKVSLSQIIDSLKFPVMVKPARGIGAVGLHKFDKPDDLLRNYDSIRNKFGNLQIQEYIPQTETQFQAEAFCDGNSKMKVCMVIAKPRFFPVTGGTSSCNFTIKRPDIENNVRRLLEGIGWIGSADIDMILDPRDNIPKILEINPRVTAGIKIGFEAGIDYADLQMRLAFGQQIPEITTYKLNVILRNLCLDFLWYKYSDKKSRKNTFPPFWQMFGRDVHYQTFRKDDPFPCIGFLLSNFKKYMRPGTWATKLGRDLPASEHK